MRSFPVLVRLIVAHLLARRTRALLGLLGVAVSVCLVIWIIRGYDAVAHGPARPPGQQADRFDVMLTLPRPMMSTGSGPGGRRRPPSDLSAEALSIAPKWLEELRQDQQVDEMIPLIRSRVRVVEPPPAMELGPFAGGTLMGTDDPFPPYVPAEGRWIQAGRGEEVVISARFGERYGLKLGGQVTIGGNGGEARLNIVGVLPADAGGGRGPMAGPFAGDLYVLTATAEHINGYAGRVNVVLLTLKDPDEAALFAQRWTEKTAEADSPLSVRSLHPEDGDSMTGPMLGMVKVQAHNSTLLAFLAASFIIFTTLSAGVRERLRELATLRAIALSKSQLVASIFFEALLYAMAGWALGLLLARLLLRVGQALAVHMRFFRAGAFADYPLGVTSLWVSGLCALLGALAAGAFPAWRAARMRPADVFSSQGDARVQRFPWVMVSVGAVLVLLNPVAVLLANVEPFSTFFSRTASRGFAPPLLACAAMIVGLALVTPLVVRMVERLLGPIMAALLRFDRRLLRQQFSGNLWRVVGTTLSLSAGLTLFVTALVWGYSMLVPFTPDKSLPRMLVSILPAGVPESAIAEVQSVDGVVAGECLPLAVEQPLLSEETLESKPFASVDASQQHMLVMGVAPQQAFSGARPVLNFTFLQGDRETATRLLASGRYCLVPDHFHTQTGLKVGDRFGVSVPNSPDQTIEYEIAGVVSVPGWNWFTKFSDIRRRSFRALAIIFADYQQVKADFGIDRISYFWMNVDERVSFEEMKGRLTPLANRYAGVTATLPGVGETLVSTQFVSITERADLIRRLYSRADSIIWSLTRFPLLALVITSLAVFNTIFASVHARFWQFGILRSVGLTRSQLFRVILSEGLLIFLAAGLLSLGGGTLLAWCGTHISTYFFYFAGRTPPLVLPWTSLSVGFGMAFGLCFLAGLIPAWQAARKQPLVFLQAGRIGL